jgi:hypothetical protein
VNRDSSREIDEAAGYIYVFPMASPGGKKKRKAVILGVGLDSDGHKRLTTGPNFALVGGTEDTHAQMTEKAIKINEKLKARGKQLEEVGCDEFDDIAYEVGLKKVKPPTN